MTKALTIDQFKERSNNIHNFKYDYSDVNYKSYYEKVKIKCTDCETIFYQKPADHLHGNGCKFCGIKRRTNVKTFSTEQFIEKAIEIHGDKFNYDKVVYTNSQTKVIITCKQHGDFYMKPNNHLRGKGCRFCKIDKLKLLNTYSNSEFIEKAKAVHGDRYIYDKTKYIDCFTPVTITCKIHGDWEEIPYRHLGHKYCPRCHISVGEDVISQILEKHNIKFITQYKIPGNNYRFRYDFYLPDYNLLIEFHGEQHFKMVKHFGGEKRYQERIKNDIFKKELAELARIPIIYFTHKHLKIPREDFEILILKRMELFKPRVANLALRQSSVSM